MSAKFVIPVCWEVYSTVEVTANSFEEAVKILTDNIDDVPLGESEYVDESYRIDECDEFTSKHLRHIGGISIDKDGIHK
ncbi:hypothetical protein RASY3_14565 [Ruminococcus albus SY3]|uniref:Uncharacterized protein n=1 Tax=Ruminococcus albus SY3 TaxID=1341156 RepID=A0A011UZD9_RUMAL|nr:hypothetical protein [Ruminococcus albus]EXM38542.1 hypothetical protein RASY3_14565 [Ruminococcus albus SY3]